MMMEYDLMLVEVNVDMDSRRVIDLIRAASDEGSKTCAICVGGYDEDARTVFDIPEIVVFMRSVMELDPEAWCRCLRMPWEDGFEEFGFALWTSVAFGMDGTNGVHMGEVFANFADAFPMTSLASTWNGLKSEVGQ